MGPKVDVTSSVIPAPMVMTDVKASPPDNNVANKIFTSSKTNAKVSSFNLNCETEFSSDLTSDLQVLLADFIFCFDPSLAVQIY